MTTVDYTETVLPELAYMVAQKGDPAHLNRAAGFTSYFEREDVLACGRDVNAARNDDTTFAEVSGVMATAATVFTIKSEFLPDLTTMYFPAEAGVAELSLVGERTFVTLHDHGAAVGDLLQRHVNDDGVCVIVRRDISGGHRELAFSGTRHAYREAQTSWRAGDATEEATDAIRRFVG